MPEKSPSALGLGITWLRCKCGWTKRRLAKALGFTDDSVLSKYERGDHSLTRDMAEFVVSPLPHPPEALDVLASAHDLIFPESLPEAPSPVSLTPEERRRAHRAGMAGAAAAATAIAREVARRIEREKEDAARQEARELWERLQGALPEDRHDLVACFPELRSWPLALLACEASVRAAARNVKEALNLATLAVSIAERVPAPETWRQRLEGYCWAHLGNVRRVAEEFDGADKAFAQAWTFWNAGADSDPPLLTEWRMLDLEASLRREQRRFSEALERLDQAREASGSDPAAAAHLLLQKEHVFSQIGDTQGALEALVEAAPFVEASGDPRLLFALRFNMADDLCHLGRFAEAAALVPLVRKLAMELGDELNLSRVVWLAARIAAGEGRAEEAIAGLEQVRQEFTDRELPYDAALSSLDLGLLWLKAGRTAEVRELALAMGWIFRAKGIDREALAALSLFCEAAKRESATVELARHTLIVIERVRRSASPEERKEAK
jgi:tetratricopeptide (TPR) repeat protein